MLNQFHQGTPDLLLKALPEGRSRDVLQLDIASQDASYVLNEPKELIQQIHYSWLTPLIEALPAKMQSLFLTSLPKNKAAMLSQVLKIPLQTTKQALSVRLYLLSRIYSQLKPTEVLPAPYLPATNLSLLLAMQKGEIVELITFLGLYDLAEEIRHIIDRRYLKAIYNCLSLKKQHFLRLCLHKKERLSVPRLGLDKWQGDCQTLERLTHHRGLVRMGKAVSGQHPDFIWHLIHRLDIGRGRLLQQYCEKEEIPGVTQVLIQEILSLMNFFKKSSDL